MARKAAHSPEVIRMDIDTTHADGEAQEILSALRQIQDNPSLRAEASTNAEGVMDRLKLSGVARHAVALGIAGMLVVPAIVSQPEVFWGS